MVDKIFNVQKNILHLGQFSSNSSSLFCGKLKFPIIKTSLETYL